MTIDSSARSVGEAVPSNTVSNTVLSNTVSDAFTERSMLPGAPWLLAHRSMLKPNRPRKISLQGQDYVLWQDRQGQIHALPNACPHMGAMLSEGWCVEASEGRFSEGRFSESSPASHSKIVCPFHALAFDAAGCTILPGSNRQTAPLLKPLELIIQGDLIWSYGGHEPQQPIPTLLNEIAAEYEFIGAVGDTSVPTDLLTMLLNMHDYNHQNGTHRPLFEIKEVQFKQFVDQGYHSHAFYDMPRKPPSLGDIVKNPALLVFPRTLSAHLENFFPCLIILHAKSPAGEFKQCHLFIPESATQTRVYALLYGQHRHPIFRLLKNNFLKLVEVVIQQDADILAKIYANAPQKVKLNNEIGMDWVRRNFASFPQNLAVPDASHPRTAD